MRKQEYSPQHVVGRWFEERLMRMFDLVRTDIKSEGRVPDFMHKDGLFYMEAKASCYKNGGVINQGQLYGFEDITNAKRFYAFGYHPITANMRETYPTEEDLIAALDDAGLKSVYVFPFSIVKTFFDRVGETNTPKHDSFVQMDERDAENIFMWKSPVWNDPSIDIFDYRYFFLRGKVRIVTKGRDFEKELRGSFHPEFL